MPKWSDEQLDRIFDRTSGRCHLCHRKLAWNNHGAAGTRGGWHVDHSRARAVGGTNYVQNLLPACITCNCSKRAGSNRGMRAKHGKTRAPLSTTRRAEARVTNGAVGAGLGAAIGGVIAGRPGAWIGGLIGAVVGGNANPDEWIM